MDKDRSENSTQLSIVSENSISWLRIVTPLATAVLAIVAVIWLVLYPISWGRELELNVQRIEFHVISVKKSVKLLEVGQQEIKNKLNKLDQRMDIFGKNIALLLHDRGLTPLTKEYLHD